MPDTPTALADMIVPTRFHEYVLEISAEVSRFRQSGIMADLTELLGGDIKGKGVDMPFFKDLAGDDQLIDDTEDLEINNIGSDQDYAVILRRALVYGSTDIAADVGGADPMQAIAARLSDKWDKANQKTLVAVVNGALSAANMTGNVFDITGLTGGAENFDGSAFIDAGGLLSDTQDSLVGCAVHGHTYTEMKQQDQIEFEKDSEGKPTIPFYKGKYVVVDDGMPKNGDEYTSYLFGPGAIGYAEGLAKKPIALGREELKGGGYEYIVHRRHFTMHARGIKWDPQAGVPAKQSTSNAELEDGGNHNRVYEPKNIRIVKFKHKLAA